MFTCFCFFSLPLSTLFLLALPPLSSTPAHYSQFLFPCNYSMYLALLWRGFQLFLYGLSVPELTPQVGSTCLGSISCLPINYPVLGSLGLVTSVLGLGNGTNRDAWLVPWVGL